MPFLQPFINLIIYQFNKTKTIQSHAVQRMDQLNENGKRTIEALENVEPPMCGCGQPKKELVQKKDGVNKGRAFYTCPGPRDQQCTGKDSNGVSIFEWKDECIARKQKQQQPPIKFIRTGGPQLKIATKAQSTSTEPKKRAELLSKEKLAEFNKKSKPIPAAFLEPQEEHTVLYKTVMNEEFDFTNYTHVKNFSSTAKKYGYKVTMAKNFEFVHHLRHMKLTKGEYDEEDDFSLRVQQYRFFKDTPNNYVLSIQVHGPQQDNEGWLKSAEVKKIVFELPKQFVIVERNLLKKFVASFVNCNSIKEITPTENRGEAFVASGSVNDFNSLQYGVYKISGTYNELWTNIYMNHLIQFMRQYGNDNLGKPVSEKCIEFWDK